MQVIVILNKPLFPEQEKFILDEYKTSYSTINIPKIGWTLKEMRKIVNAFDNNSIIVFTSNIPKMVEYITQRLDKHPKLILKIKLLD